MSHVLVFDPLKPCLFYYKRLVSVSLVTLKGSWSPPAISNQNQKVNQIAVVFFGEVGLHQQCLTRNSLPRCLEHALILKGQTLQKKSKTKKTP